MNNFKKEDFFNRISIFLVRNDMTEGELSLKLGFPKYYFTRLKKGEVPFTIDIFIKVLEILNISTTEFFIKENILFIEAYNNLPIDDKLLVKKIVYELSKKPLKN